MSSSQEKPSLLTLQTFDGEKFTVDEAAATQSMMIKNMLDDGCAWDVIPLPNVDGKTMKKVVEYCNRHAAAVFSADDTAAAGGGGELEKFDKEFIEVGEEELFHVLLAANYLEIKGLLDLACQKVADIIKGKMPEEIREWFNIKNDFTPEEEEEIRKQNPWAFE